MNNTTRAGLACAGCLWVLSGIPAVASDVYRLIVGEDLSAIAVGGALAQQAEPHVRRTRAVLFDVALLAAESPLKAGDLLQLELFDNVLYPVVVDRVVRGPSGALTIQGTIQGRDFATVTLTSQKGVVLGTVQDVENRRLYRIRSIERGRFHLVLDYDVESMPPTYDLDPIVPPQAEEEP